MDRSCSRDRSGPSWWIIPVVGLASLVWFLLRVPSKPSRLAYPCQRLAAPLAGGFTVWLVWLTASALALGRKRYLWSQSRLAFIGVCLVAAAGAGLLALADLPGKPAIAANPTPNRPLGVGRGIYTFMQKTTL